MTEDPTHLKTVFEAAVPEAVRRRIRDQKNSPSLTPPLQPERPSDKRFLLRLSETRPTSELETERSKISQALDDDRETHILAKGTKNKMLDTLAWYDVQIPLARQRDEIQAGRPEGCWCLGIGGRGEVGIPVTTIPDDDADWPMTFRDFCECPEGVEAKASRDREMAEYETDARTIKIRRVLGRSDFSRYEGQTWETYLAKVEAKVGTVTDDVRSTVRLLKYCPRQADWFYVWGPFGTGKTAAMAIMAVEMVEDHPDLILSTVGDLLDQVQATFGRKSGGDEPTTDDVLHAYRETSLLLLDDIANENESVTAFARTTVWRLLNDRYRAKRLTGFTSNISPSELEQRIGPAMSQRILEDVFEVNMSHCPNLRLRESA
jgi:DNA replication protein DnaC